MPTPISTEYMTADEVAAWLRWDKDTVIKHFEKRPGVIDLGTGETRTKRRRRCLRIPRVTVEKFLVEKRSQ